MKFITENRDGGVFVGLDLGNSVRLGITLPQEVQKAEPGPSEGFAYYTVTRSSHLKEVAYLKCDQLLRITFSEGTQYEYEGVPESVVQSLLVAESMGKFFNSNIKNVYPAYKLEEV